MSEPIKDGGAAFPHESYDHDGGFDAVNPGMSLRDYFAAAALPAAIEGCAADKLLNGETRVQMFARKAFECADAMLAAREVKHG